MAKYKVTATDGLNVRTVPTPANNVPIGVLPLGSIVDVIGTTANGWHQLGPVVVSGVTLAKGQAYAISDWLVPVADPPPIPTTGKTGLGVNVITGDMGVVNRSLAAGCTAAGGINMFGQLSDLAASRPEMVVTARRYVTSMPPADPDVLFEGAGSPHLVYLTPLNECDVICNGSPQQIAERASYDRAMWAKMKARGRKYAGGGFSVGTAEYTSQAVCDAMRTHYAPLYNDGMGFNYHLYSPWKGHKMDIWYEFRWRFLFERCGFDPNPALAGIYCDETGVDQGSLGGFPACGYTAQEVGAWCRAFLDGSQGNGYGNLLRAALIFQGGNTSTTTGGWAGYNVDRPDYLAAIGAAAQAPVMRTLNLPRMIDTAQQPDIVPTPRKVIAQWEGEWPTPRKVLPQWEATE